MSKYVMSDIHGCFDKFKQMLQMINFSKEDELYILGDIFDRGPQSLEILDYILGNKNMFLLKGNHEHMFQEYFESKSPYMWYCNGGEVTHNQMLMHEYMKEEHIYRYIKSLPFIKVVDKFILVHASVLYVDGFENMSIDEFIASQEEENCIWDRINIGKEKQFKDYTVICGHTPVQTILKNNDAKIIHKEGTIYIDCGAVFKDANGQLACLNIDTMEEFYV